MAMALSSHSTSSFFTTTGTHAVPHTRLRFHSSNRVSRVNFLTKSTPAQPCLKNLSGESFPQKWRVGISFFSSFIRKRENVEELKEELLGAISELDRGANATPEDQQNVDQIARRVEAANPTKEPLKSNLLNGKWELIYTTSRSILQREASLISIDNIRIRLKNMEGGQKDYINLSKELQVSLEEISFFKELKINYYQRPKLLRSSANYQAINLDTLRAQNMESSPFFNQVTADLTPLNARTVAVKFDFFKIFGLIPVKAPESARGELEITYLDEELRISRGDKGNLFILKMIDPSYRIPA